MAVRKSKKGAALKKWFKEEWVDVKTGKPCGRKSAKKGESKRPYPSCRPKAVAAKMTKGEKASTALGRQEGYGRLDSPFFADLRPQGLPVLTSTHS